MKNITDKDLMDLMEAQPGARIIDVRTKEEVAEGVIEGAEHLNLMDPNFTHKINSLPKDGHYVLVCRSGGRSYQACSYMMKEGFQNVYNLMGGMMDWTGDISQLSVN